MGGSVCREGAICTMCKEGQSVQGGQRVLGARRRATRTGGGVMCTGEK